MKTYTQEELQTILANHALWLRGQGGERANLGGADLSGADLSRANLSDADLSRADLVGAVGVNLALARCSHLPEGEFTAWKKCAGGVVVKLRIPEDAKRSHGAGRKCRAERALVVDVIGAEYGVSLHDDMTKFVKGEMVEADSWCDDRWQECAPGIHFFITRLEAEAYVM